MRNQNQPLRKSKAAASQQVMAKLRTASPVKRTKPVSLLKSSRNQPPKLTIVLPEVDVAEEAVVEQEPLNLLKLLQQDDGNDAEPTVARKERAPYDGSTAFKLYLREVGETKLLSPLEEVQLAKRIKKGDKKAREQMIRANLRLVVKIARGYEECGVPLLDLISEGNIGLMKAVERFDPAKGAKLSTYSAWWIKQNIKHALANQSKTIRLPAHVVDKLFRMRRASAELQSLLGREPSDEELSEEVGFSAKKVGRLRQASIPPVSLEAPRMNGDEDSSPLADTLRDDSANTPYERLEEKSTNSMLHELIQDLAPRELEIIRQRFGLDGKPEKTLDEVGHKLGVTRERIRQIQNCALNKLRKGVERLETCRVAA